MTLPIALPGRDVAGQAQTGTGKTLAFLVALVNRLLTRPALADRGPADPRALILAPTRELAIQIHKDAVKFAADLGLRFALIYGGVDYDKQRAQLHLRLRRDHRHPGPADRLRAPGRRAPARLRGLHPRRSRPHVRPGLHQGLRFLLRKLPRREERQTLLFSATLSHRVLELAYEHMNEPEKVVVETDIRDHLARAPGDLPAGQRREDCRC